jgi:hypothetical protein
MTMEVTVNDRTFYVIADDLTTYEETRAMLEERMAAGPPDEERDEITRDIAEVEVHLDRIRSELAAKSDALAAVLDRLDIERGALHQRRDRLKVKEQAVERALRGLRDYTVRVMRANGLKRIKTPESTLFLRETKAVDILDPDLIPSEYQNAEVKLPLWLWEAIVQLVERSGSDDVAGAAASVRVKAEPSISTIRKAIESGVDVDGADMRLNTHLVCR